MMLEELYRSLTHHEKAISRITRFEEQVTRVDLVQFAFFQQKPGSLGRQSAKYGTAL
jgi:hypothetical protein